MFRPVFLALIMFFASLPAAHAQESVSVRSGDHEGYSRLVFDWGRTVEYDVKTDASGKVVITFQKDALLNKNALSDKLAKNVKGVEVVSQNPLTVMLRVPAGSKTRNLRAGNRILLDIYDAPGQVATPAVVATPVPAPVKTDTKVAEKTPQPKPVEKTEVKKAEEKPKLVMGPPKPIAVNEAVKVEAKKTVPVPPQVKVSEKFGPAAPAVLPKKKGLTPEVVKVEAPDTRQLARPKPEKTAPQAPAVEPAVKPATETATIATPAPVPVKKLAEPTVISLSAIDSIDLAVFERGEKIWLISHLQNMMLRPQVTGPEESRLMPLNTNDKGAVKTFQLTRVPGSVLRAQGGGVLWRILFASDETILPKEKNMPIEPVFEAAEGASKIVWPFKEVSKIADVEDPVSGKMLKILTVRSGEQYAGPARDFIDFETFPSPLGVAILPKVDDLQVNLTARGLEITRPGGLHLTSAEEMTAILKDREKLSNRPKVDPSVNRIFDFNDWQMGGVSSVEQNKNILLGNLPKRPDAQRVGGLITLAKMYLSHGMWAEAQGFLSFAEKEAPELAQNPEFKALRGAAQVFGLESELAFNNLSAPELKVFPEINYWRAAALAHLGDWLQAGEIMPRDLAIVADYPPGVLNRLSLIMAEIALRAGDKKSASDLLGFIQDGELPLEQKSALDYLKGELARQNGKIEDTKKLWEPLAMGADPQFRVKAGLAMTRLLAQENKIKPQQAIAQLERLRYAWRGDELEAQVNYWLGHTYYNNGDYIKGLKIMRDAAGYAGGTDLAETVTAEMTDAFAKLFLSPQLDNVSAVDAAVIYHEFSELIPPGEKGDQIANRLIDHLIKYDLFQQAETLLQAQFDRRLQGQAAYDAGVRLAAIYLLDKKPVNAITVLNKTTEHLQKLPVAEQTPLRLRQIALLRARAFSAQNKPEQAMAILSGLSDGVDVNRLRADIAWRAGYWDDASEALGYVLADENVPTSAKPNEEQSSLILRYAVALNLSNDRIRLANLREKYNPAMSQSDKARVFEMVTRSWQTALLEDRQALMSMVSEVDLFENFLNNSGGTNGAGPAAGAPTTPAPAAVPAPATTAPSTSAPAADDAAVPSTTPAPAANTPAADAAPATQGN